MLGILALSTTHEVIAACIEAVVARHKIHTYVLYLLSTQKWHHISQTISLPFYCTDANILCVHNTIFAVHLQKIQEIPRLVPVVNIDAKIRIILAFVGA